MKPTIAVAGAGVAGAVLANALCARDDVDVVVVERVGLFDHTGAGTGLNVGPNALKSLAAHLPRLAADVRAASLPWRHWFVALTDGSRLLDLPLSEVADNDGIRIRWSELYRVLREPVAELIRFQTGAEALTLGEEALLTLTSGETVKADLVVASDGRYSAIRHAHFEHDEPRHLGVAIFRVLMEQPEGGPIDDYGQWFNGPNRLLAFRVPGGMVYCAGSFPIEERSEIPAKAKTVEAVRARYTPPAGLDRACRFLVDGIVSNIASVHWARIQEAPMRFAHPSGRLVLLGDAAHAMVPTLGQGATMAIEDACVAAEAIAGALDSGAPLSTVPAAIEARRAERIQFALDFSRDASDTMLPGSDPVAGTLAKGEPPFRAKLTRLFRDAPVPGRPCARQLVT